MLQVEVYIHFGILKLALRYLPSQAWNTLLILCYLDILQSVSMSSSGNPPKSPTLIPPRKSVELEDPGAHELGTFSALLLLMRH